MLQSFKFVALFNFDINYLLIFLFDDLLLALLDLLVLIMCFFQLGLKFNLLSFQLIVHLIFSLFSFFLFLLILRSQFCNSSFKVLFHLCFVLSMTCLQTCDILGMFFLKACDFSVPIMYAMPRDVRLSGAKHVKLH